ncbi:hypothetical protein Tfer_3259 [Thermincola ferriacetica]|uniref:Conserved hypothetical protein CHP02391 domain-containing protein n=1 Tax=Thermincola ferriacetica TaxID=281456 RepID=A0A0L6VYB9_9FIRM|nr:TIGR02391 family protein [Thermincola ferriacetica]KNZ68206.1 hypothetical protein Tfer_3259 [Thermincola ferriacetica]
MMYLELFKRVKYLNLVLKELPGVVTDKENEVSLEVLLKDKELKQVVCKLFRDGHHARAVEEAFKFLNNLVKKKAKVDPSIDGAKLMKQVFSVNNPVLKINTGVSQSEKDEQLGYMEIFSGCMTGIRNPRAHEHEWEDTQQHAIQLLIMADHLVERVRNSAKVKI